MVADVQISPARRLQGRVRVPGDKSIAHRALFCGALARGCTRIVGVPRSADVYATIGALNACGVQTERKGNVVMVEGNPLDISAAGRTIDCANSGTTMRVLMGVLASRSGPVRLTGDASLCRRPMNRIAEPLARMGAHIELTRSGQAPVTLNGFARLAPIQYELPIPSAQLKTALLFAALGASGTTGLCGRIASRDHTERILPQFGAALRTTDKEIIIEGRQALRAACIEVPGDPSSAAFWIAAALVTCESEIEITEVCLNSTRAGFIDVLSRMGARIQTALLQHHPEPIGSVHIRSADLQGTVVHAHEIPSLIDELPLLAVIATHAHGTTVVRGAGELRVKESDRLRSIAMVLRAMGADIETFDDGFAITGPQLLRGATIDAGVDHRIIMAAAIAALRARGQTTIQNAQWVGVSYPSFFSTLRMLGGDGR
jgi:3-phosphoshikimate 1-carboxyvinyltransferase